MDTPSTYCFFFFSTVADDPQCRYNFKVYNVGQAFTDLAGRTCECSQDGSYRCKEVIGMCFWYISVCHSFSLQNRSNCKYFWIYFSLSLLHQVQLVRAIYMLYYKPCFVTNSKIRCHRNIFSLQSSPNWMTVRLYICF